MGYRTVFGFGIIASGFVGALGLSAPVATAELPPGITCVQTHCRNDTDDNYVVRGTVTCHEPHTVDPTRPVEFMVTVHNNGRPSPSWCNTERQGANGHHYSVPSNNYTLYADGAVVHNAPLVQSGSGGW
ncbi:hypothetical protein [Nocardia carnea]|uniref:hypothetical protein n=1 Tax=Nocardia carnea TaxID=37328 RepID=UPI002453798F|nr:hypothetical protein [Nocardia carnea]